jgi:hypothetical protein
VDEGARASAPQRADDSLTDFISDFLEDCRLRGMTHYSVLSYSSALRSFRKHRRVRALARCSRLARMP